MFATDMIERKMLESGHTRHSLARAMGRSPSTINAAFARGRCRPELAQAMAKFLGMPTARLKRVRRVSETKYV